MAERRNYDFHDLSARLTFPPTNSCGDAFNVYQCDALFWMVSQYMSLLSSHLPVHTFMGSRVVSL